jgi:predicted metalloenzyme YecM
MKTLNDCIGDSHIFLDSLFTMISDIELNIVDSLVLDHICYRVGTLNEYKTKKEELLTFAELLVESMVNGRLISTFKLFEPIVFNKRSIFLIELPQPKNTFTYKTGLEHAEFVTKEPLQKIVNRYPQFAFETFGINKKINADITLKLGDYCIRFHNQSLEDVIKLEKTNGRPKNYSK